MENQPPRRTFGAYARHYRLALVRVFWRKPSRRKKRINGAPILPSHEAYNLISSCIASGTPQLVSRLGTTESTIIDFFLKNAVAGKCEFPNDLKSLIMRNSGFFPSSDELLSEFCEKSLALMGEIDVLGVRSHPIEHNFWDLEERMIQASMTRTKFVDLEELSPVGRTDSWTHQLAGKKILVIHPFAKTISAQFLKRKVLFPDEGFLPDFELEVVAAVQSAGDNQMQSGFSDWFSALESMNVSLRKKDFDVALIGAGAYGLFLGAECKKLGKTAIHIGGATQLLFGIVGRRWVEETGTSSQDVKSLVNEHWTSPADSETPVGERSVEGGGYWV